MGSYHSRSWFSGRYRTRTYTPLGPTHFKCAAVRPTLLNLPFFDPPGGVEPPNSTVKVWWLCQFVYRGIYGFQYVNERLFYLSFLPGSNRWHLHYKWSALPTELRKHIKWETKNPDLANPGLNNCLSQFNLFYSGFIYARLFKINIISKATRCSLNRTIRF